ncbi:MAG: PAS domain S-box protein, partial [Caldilinea sp.]|nr:PAS domain S-box protein [Caldilinea sp.]
KLYDPADRQAIVDTIHQEGQLNGWSMKYRTKDGGTSECLMSIAVAPVNGVPCYLAGTVDLGPLRRAEAALRASEAKFTTLFEMSPISMTIARAADGVFVDVNSAALQAIGYARDEFLGSTAQELGIYADQDERAAMQAAVRRDGGVSGWPVTLRSKPGDTHACLISVASVVVDDEACYLSGIVDIDRLRQAEAALRAREAEFAALFEMSPVAMIITRADNARVVMANAAFEQLTGYAREEVVGHTAQEFDVYVDPAERAPMMAEVLRNGSVSGRPIMFRHSKGRVGECLLSIAKMPVNGVDCFVSGVVDIQPLRDAEAALRAQQADMLAMLENTDGTIWSIDRDYRLTASNSVFRRNVTASLGRALELGESVFQLSDGEINAEWRSMYDRALAGERLAVDVQRRFSKRGNWMEYRFSPVYDADGGIVGATVLGRDITARKLAAQQIEAQLAEISHYYDTAPVGLAVLDVDLRYLRVNQLLAAMNGKPVEAHIGKTVDDVVPLIAGQLRQMAATTLATGEAFIGIEIVGGTPAEPSVLHTLKCHWHPIKHSDGTIIGFNAMVEDITDRKHAQARRERSEQNMAHAQRIGHLGSWEWDVLNDRLEWTDELYRIFGVDREFVPTYASVERMIHPDDRAYDSARVREALAAGSNAEFEVRIVRPDGTIRHIYENIEIQRDATGAPMKLFGIVQDITERKQAEAALRRSEHNLNEAERISNSGSWE